MEGSQPTINFIWVCLDKLTFESQLVSNACSCLSGCPEREVTKCRCKRPTVQQGAQVSQCATFCIVHCASCSVLQQGAVHFFGFPTVHWCVQLARRSVRCGKEMASHNTLRMRTILSPLPPCVQCMCTFIRRIYPKSKHSVNALY